MASPSPSDLDPVHSLIPDKRPVLATEVFNRRPARRDPDQRMTPRDSGGVQENLHVGVAAENVLPLVERDAAAHPFQRGRKLRRRDSRRRPVSARGTVSRNA